MKKSILVILIVLLAFTVWSVMAFGKAKKEEGVDQPTQIHKAELRSAPRVTQPVEVQKAEQAPVEFPEVVLPKPHAVRPTVEDFKAELATKGRTPEQLEALMGENVPIDVESAEKAPYYCRVRNQPDGGYWQPGGNPYLYCWGQIGLATYLNLDHNYYTDCPYPLYPFMVTQVGWQIYASDTCTIVSEARIWSVDNSGGVPYPLAELCTSDILNPVVTAHVGAWAYITIPLEQPCCVYDEFFAVAIFDNSDDFNDTDYCTPMYLDYILSLVFDGSGGKGQSYWNPYDGTGGNWYDVVDYGFWSGALRVEAYGYTADQNECEPPQETWYYKEGMPDFYQYNEAFPNNGAAYCGPTAGANSIWWFSCVQGDFPPSWGGCLEGDEIALTNEIAMASGTDPLLGTNCDLLQEGIINTIYAHGGWWFFEETVYDPDFWYIQKELRDCEDVVLLLAFVQEDPPGSENWYIFGRHFVTLAGVDIYNLQIAISDPATTPPGYAIYDVAWPSASPCGFLYLPDYVANWPDFQGQNLGPCTIPPGTYNPQYPVYVEVEQAIAVSPGPYEQDGEVDGSGAYEIESNFGGIKDWGVVLDGAWTYATTYAQCGSFYLGNSDTTMAGVSQNFYPTYAFVPTAAPLWQTFDLEGAAGTYTIEQLTFRYDHPDIGLRVTKYAFGVWVPEGGTEDCEYAIEDVYVVENISGATIDNIAKGVLIDLDGPAGNGDGAGYDQTLQTVWMYDLLDSSYMFGITEKPASTVKPATGYCLDNQARMWGDYAVDSMYYWMRDLGWGMDTTTDYGYLLTDPLFSLAPGQIVINKYLKWGYYDTIEPYDGQLDQGSKHFLFNVLHQEGFYRGDVNKDGKLDISDVIYMINYLFKGGAKPVEFTNQMDVNCDGKTDISDVIYCINYMFKGGAAPVDKNRFFLESPYVDQAHKDAYINRAPGLFGDPDWKDLGK